MTSLIDRMEESASTGGPERSNLPIWRDPEVAPQGQPPQPPFITKSKTRKVTKPILNRSITFVPPITAYPQPIASPRKFRSSSSPRRQTSNPLHNKVQMPPPAFPISYTDSLHKYPGTHTRALSQPIMNKPQKAFFSHFPPAHCAYSIPPKSQPMSQQYPASQDSLAAFPQPQSRPLQPLKRSLSDAGHMEDEDPAKKAKVEETSILIPLPAQMPPVHDDGEKPGYSYATLIGMAILRAPQRRLTLAQIYGWICSTFAYYRKQQTTAGNGWQNSIRHNLSLCRDFTKQERPKDDPGKGNYWLIVPGQEARFLKDRPMRKPTMSQVQSAHLANQVMKTEPLQASQSFETSLKLPDSIDISSDATIPLSDPENPYEEADHLRKALLPSNLALPSSPPLDLQSSPPVDHSSRVRLRFEDINPADPQSSVDTHSIKRRMLEAMDDSGYFSSFESSAVRGDSKSKMSQTRGVKRGRAEEEIARIRHSSHDSSPLKPHSNIAQPINLVSIPSSPPQEEPQRKKTKLNPLTPRLRFPIPSFAAPFSVSPNTNLQNHRNQIRQLVGSPLKDDGLLDETLPAWTPGNVSGAFMGPVPDLHLSEGDYYDGTSNGSPMKRSIGRPRMDRATTFTGDVRTTLSDITKAHTNLLQSLQRNSNKQSPIKTPRKQMPRAGRAYAHDDFDIENMMPSGGLFPTGGKNGSPIGLFGDEFLPDDSGIDNLFDLNGEMGIPSTPEDSGIDLLGGFSKIGAIRSAKKLRMITPSRPSLSRTNTNFF